MNAEFFLGLFLILAIFFVLAALFSKAKSDRIICFVLALFCACGIGAASEKIIFIKSLTKEIPSDKTYSKGESRFVSQIRHVYGYDGKLLSLTLVPNTTISEQ